VRSERSRLFWLFEPESATLRHFAVLTAVLNRKGVVSKVAHAALGLVVNFLPAALVGCIPAALLFMDLDRTSALWPVAIVLCALLLAAGAVGSAATWAILSLLKALPGQAFGLSRGYRHKSYAKGESQPLTNFLHSYFQELARKPLDAPLTFGDLENAPAGAGGPQGIRLQMMTTALTLGRPYSIPFRQREFYFRKGELSKYFPPEVIEWMEENPGERSNALRDEKMKEFGYLPLPAHETLPVVVATRMSLSFPLLLSAIPLYRHAWEDGRSSQKRDAASTEEAGPTPERYTKERVQRVLFSDGGICSNFPVHLFDSVLPAWPTFGINLRDDLRDGDSRANLPPRGNSLPPERYAIGTTEGGGDLFEFGAAIVRTMQNWRDNLQRAAPGFRDRVVTVSHTPEEGGLNLDMEREAIENLAGSGKLAADELIAAFATHTSKDPDDYWTYHRWVRLRSLLAVMQEGLAEIHDGVTSSGNDPVYPDLLQDSPAYVGGSYRLRVAEREMAGEILSTLGALHDESEEIDFTEHAPKPAVQLRIQPMV
jgi:hypothetical protein